MCQQVCSFWGLWGRTVHGSALASGGHWPFLAFLHVVQVLLQPLPHHLTGVFSLYLCVFTWYPLLCTSLFSSLKDTKLVEARIFPTSGWPHFHPSVTTLSPIRLHPGVLRVRASTYHFGRPSSITTGCRLEHVNNSGLLGMLALQPSGIMGNQLSKRNHTKQQWEQRNIAAGGRHELWV